MYLAAYSPALAIAYFKSALATCKMTGTRPSILLHSLDFLGAADCSELAFFPAMNLDYSLKRSVLYATLSALRTAFSVGPLIEMARS
jgi:hypothetical protein